MNKIVLTLMLAFFVQVKVPAGMSRTYENVKSVDGFGGFTLRLVLENDKVVYVPALFTIIEEK